MHQLTGWRRPDEGVVFVISGPSGVGKSTLIGAAINRIEGLVFSVSATTRPPREGETHGQDYYFLDRAAFDDHLRLGAFLEHALVYDHRYGTLAEPTRLAVAAGQSLILDIDLQGARQVRDRWPSAVHIALLPPSIADLERRLRARGTEHEAVIARRMQQVADQLGGVAEFDYLVVNDDLETTHAVFQGVLLAEMSRTSRRQSLVRFVADELDARARTS